MFAVAFGLDVGMVCLAYDAFVGLLIWFFVLLGFVFWFVICVLLLYFALLLCSGYCLV